MSIRRRLEVLEGRVAAKQSEPEDRSEVRTRMKESLDQIARLRRGELDPEEAAKVGALTADIERRMAQRRGEGGRQ